MKSLINVILLFACLLFLSGLSGVAPSLYAQVSEQGYEESYYDTELAGSNQEYFSPTDNGSNQVAIIVFFSILGVFAICYIVSRVRVKRGLMVITANAFDQVLILLSPIAFFVAWCIGFNKELTPFQIVLLVISGVALLGALAFAVNSNRGRIGNILLAVSSKLFIFIFTIIVLLLILSIIIISILLFFTRNREGEDATFIVKYDHLLDRWTGYRID